MSELVEKVAVEIGVVIADYVNPETDFSKALRIGAKAAIAVVLVEMMKPSEDMFTAYRKALKNGIRSMSPDERKDRWGDPEPRLGFKLPERDKTRFRHAAMLRAFAAEHGIELEAPQADTWRERGYEER